MEFNNGTIGLTIFYIIGALFVIGAELIILFAKIED